MVVMNWLQQMQQALNGPSGDKCEGFSLSIEGRRRWAAFILAVTSTGCLYTPHPDPEHQGRVMIWVTGDLEQLKAFLNNAEMYPDLVSAT